MMRVNWTSLLGGLAAWLILGGLLSADEIADDLATVSKVGPGGRGSATARTATLRLSRSGLELLPRLLESMDTDNVVAANWYRTVYETITRRELARDPVPEFPVSLLKTYITDPRRRGRARRLALDLVERLEPGTTKRLIPGLLDDPEFRDDAVTTALSRGDRAKQAGRGAEAIAEYRKAFRAARNPGQVGTAADKLKGVGQEVSVVTQMGFVIDWHLLGPFDAPGTTGFELVLPPETQVKTGVDLKATYVGKGGGRGEGGCGVCLHRDHLASDPGGTDPLWCRRQPDHLAQRPTGPPPSAVAQRHASGPVPRQRDLEEGSQPDAGQDLPGSSAQEPCGAQQLVVAVEDL